MTINIVSNDERYFHLNKMLIKDGYESKISKIDGELDGNIIILPIKKEHTESELSSFFSNVKYNTLVLSPYGENVIDYSNNEAYLKKNAYLTAEGAILLYYKEIKETLLGKKISILGYGRIAKYLAKMLKSQGATVYVFARRPEIKAEIVLDGFNSIELDEIKKIKPFVIFNTIPQEIFLDKIEAYKIELASTNGFRYSDGVINGRGLPGKMFPKAAAEILYYTIKPILTAREKA